MRLFAVRDYVDATTKDLVHQINVAEDNLFRYFAHHSSEGNCV
ncbi:MAG: hypothetical protein JJP05_08905 [cyanobacterium endosymbiont of Rhopalodia gibba]